MTVIHLVNHGHYGLKFHVRDGQKTYYFGHNLNDAARAFANHAGYALSKERRKELDDECRDVQFGLKHLADPSART